MDRINVLEDSTSRLKLFTKDLLAETNDSELQEIVKNASKEFNSPIALVSLVLDQVQFFKAHIGLPQVLAEARGTHRDVSFCQFVVKDGKSFEVNDAANDPRIPQHVVKEYNIQSYLGVPIKVDKMVMGSLCVLDTKKREFSEKEHNSLKKLADLVNIRLKHITKERKQTRLDLTEATLIPAITELSHSLKSIENFIQLGYSSGKSMQTFINHSNHIFSDESNFSDAIRLSHEAASKANKQNEDFLLEMEFALSDSMDCIKALESLLINVELTPISEIITSAQDLSRNSTKLIGGFPLPDFKSDPIIYAKGNLALAIITNCLLLLSSEIGIESSNNGIELNINEKPTSIELVFTAPDINEASMLNVYSSLNKLMASEMPSLKLSSTGIELILDFRIINKTIANNVYSALKRAID
jgi:hypothetical protein